jgi:hypothetical protein
MTIQITRPELEALIKERLRTGEYDSAEELILEALRASGAKGETDDEGRTRAIEELRTFGKDHGLSLGGMTIRELRDEARP